MYSKIGILKVIGQPNNRATMVVKMHNTSDIITQMQNAHYENSAYAKKIANRFKGATNKQTCRNIFNWIKQNIDYRVEPATLQTTKTLQRLVSDGYGDCKHYSGFFAAILSALNIKNNYRFASYNSNTTPTHVYVVAYDEQNKPIVCDAVLNKFNTEKKFTHKLDKSMLMQLSGIDTIGRPKFGAGIKKAVQAPKKAVQAAAKKVKAAAAKVPANAKKIGIAPARAAFLSLVALNVRGFATKLSKANQSELKKKWSNLGGDFSKLQNVINNGSKRKALLSGFEDDQIGVAVATGVTATIATATPILVALQNFIKENPAFVATAKQAFKEKTGQGVENTPFDSQPDAGVTPGESNNTGSSTDTAVVKTAAEPATTMPSGINSKALLIGGAAIAALLLFKKK